MATKYLLNQNSALCVHVKNRVNGKDKNNFSIQKALIKTSCWDFVMKSWKERSVKFLAMKKEKNWKMLSSNQSFSIAALPNIDSFEFFQSFSVSVSSWFYFSCKNARLVQPRKQRRISQFPSHFMPGVWYCVINYSVFPCQVLLTLPWQFKVNLVLRNLPSLFAAIRSVQIQSRPWNEGFSESDSLCHPLT